MKRDYFRLFLVGFLLIMLQSFIQYNTAFNNMINGAFDSIRPFIYAIFIAILVSPLVNFFERKTKMKRWLAIGVSLFLVFLAIIGLCLIVIPNITSSVRDLSYKFPTLVKGFNSSLNNLIQFLQEKNLAIIKPEDIENTIITFVKTNLSNIKNIIGKFGSGVVNSALGLMNFFLGVFISLYLLESKEYFMKFIENLFLLFMKEKEAKECVNFVKKINNIFLKYILGRILTSVVVGITVSIIMYIAGAPYAMLSGVLIGVGNMIPYVGSIVAGVISTFLIILVAPIKIIWLIVAICVGQAVDGFVIGPKIMAESVGISSFWTIIAVMVCGSLFGTVGMFLGVPAFAVLKLVYLECLRRRKEKLRS